MGDDPLPFINLLKDLLQRKEKLENRNQALESDNNHYKGVIQSMNEARENWNRSGVPILSPPGNPNLAPSVALAGTEFALNESRARASVRVDQMRATAPR